MSGSYTNWPRTQRVRPFSSTGMRASSVNASSIASAPLRKPTLVTVNVSAAGS